MASLVFDIVKALNGSVPQTEFSLSLHNFQRVCTPTPYWLRCLMYGIPWAADSLFLSLYLDGWYNSCEVLFPPLLLRNPYKDRTSEFGVQKEVFTYFFLHAICVCVCNPNHNISLSISTTEEKKEKKALFRKRNQHQLSVHNQQNTLEIWSEFSYWPSPFLLFR